jgi:hypothetical protein
VSGLGRKPRDQAGTVWGVTLLNGSGQDLSVDDFGCSSQGGRPAHA